MTLNVHEKGFTILKAKLAGKKGHFVFLSFYFGAKNRSPALGMATRS